MSSEVDNKKRYIEGILYQVKEIVFKNDNLKDYKADILECEIIYKMLVDTKDFNDLYLIVDDFKTVEDFCVNFKFIKTNAKNLKKDVTIKISDIEEVRQCIGDLQ